MTTQDHLFALIMYARQSAKFHLLFEILKTRGVVEADDMLAFLSHAADETDEAQEWFYEAWKTYQATAKSLGVTTGLEDWKPPTVLTPRTKKSA